MKRRAFIDMIAAGMAIFAMFFGAGNIIFPLALGQYALDKTPIALMGFLLTGILTPFVGMLTMFLYKGETGPFFDRFGRIPGKILACFTIALLGPVGCAPRCLAFAHSTCLLSFPHLSAFLFSLIGCIGVFLFTFNKGRILELIGFVLSPLKIGLLVTVALVGLIHGGDSVPLVTDKMSGSQFFHGLTEGYNTMDLLGVFFMAPIVYFSLKRQDKSYVGEGLTRFLLIALLIGAFLLASIYISFCYLTYLYASELTSVPIDRLLPTVAIHILGPTGGLLVSLTVVVACFTTTIALIASFASYLQTEIFNNKIGYVPLVIASLTLTFLLTNLGFQGILDFLSPILSVTYPILILLTLYNLVHRLFKGAEPLPVKES